jgi:hypothetical protein
MEGGEGGGEGLREKKPRRPETDDQKPIHAFTVGEKGGEVVVGDQGKVNSKKASQKYELAEGICDSFVTILRQSYLSM